MHSKLFSFLIVMSKIVIKKKRKQPYPRCLSKLSFILTKKKKLKSLSIRRIVFHNIQEIESFLHFPLCGWWRSGKIGKLHNDVFRFFKQSFRRNNQSFVNSRSLSRKVFHYTHCVQVLYGITDNRTWNPQEQNCCPDAGIAVEKSVDIISQFEVTFNYREFVY